MKNRLFVRSLALLSLVACGSGSESTSSTGSSSSIQAQFIDSPVKGLNVVRTLSGAGVTGLQGRFDCESGEEVTFSLRNLVMGSAKCGEKIYLDDIAAGERRDNIAAVLQNLSTTAANSGLIDLSHVPAAQNLNIDLTIADDSAITAAITNLRTEVAAASGASLTPAVDVATAASHANSNLPSPDEVMKAIYEEYKANPPRVLFTDDGSTDEACWKYYTAEVEVQKVGSGYFAGIKEGTQIASNDVPVDSCADGALLSSCENEDRFWGTLRLIKDKTTYALIDKKEDTYTINEGVDEVEKNIKVVSKDFLTNKDEVIETSISENGQSRKIVNIKEYFPFTSNNIEHFSLNFGNNREISGWFFSDYQDLSIENYVSENDYTLVKKRSGCSYKITKR